MISEEEKNTFFSSQIIKWSKSIQRNLPWKTQDPYKIWVSEIILQQTQVSQGLPYYLRFIERFPEIQALASAEENEVYYYWKGLGYYARVRNMHTTAKLVVNQLKGIMPQDFESLRALKGIGDYTAAAIASFAYNETVAVLDGNVHRVLSRYFGINKTIEKSTDKRLFQDKANQLVPAGAAGLYNQAIMDLGSMVCKPRSAKCDQCPLSLHCIAYATNRVELLPPAKKRQALRHRYFIYYYLVNAREETLINQRQNKDIWAQLFELPGREVKNERAKAMPDKKLKTLGINGQNIKVDKETMIIKHQLSHQMLHIKFISLRCDEFSHDNRFHKIKRKNLSNFAFPKPIQSFLNKN